MKNDYIVIKGTKREFKEQIEKLKRKYGANTPIKEFINDPFLFVEN